MSEPRFQQKYQQVLVQIGGIAIFLAGAVFRKNWTAEFDTLFRHIPGLKMIPENNIKKVVDWYQFISDSPFMALVYLDLFDLVNYFLVMLGFFALFYIYREKYPKLMYPALILILSSFILHVIYNPAIPLFIYANQYFSTTSSSIKSDLLIQGQKSLENYRVGILPSWPMAISLLCFALAGLIFSVVIIKSQFVKKWVAIFGIIAHSFLSLHVLLIPLIPDWSFLFIPSASVFLLIWHVSFGYRILKWSNKTRIINQ